MRFILAVLLSIGLAATVTSNKPAVTLGAAALMAVAAYLLRRFYPGIWED